MEIASPSAAGALVAALEDRDSDVRWLAAETLAALGRDAVRPLLEALMQRVYSPSLRESAQHTLNALIKAYTSPALIPVLAALQGVTPEVDTPVAARKALQELARE